MQHMEVGHLGADCSLQLLDGVHLVPTGEGGEARVLLPLHGGIELGRGVGL